MTQTAKLVVVALLVVLALLPSRIPAADVDFSDLDQRLSRLEREMKISPAARQHSVRTVAFLSDEALPINEPRRLANVSCAAASYERCECCDGTCETASGPQCGDAMECYGDSSLDERCCTSGGCGCRQRRPSDYYAEVQLLWLRTHMSQGAIGKLSEQYELSPRIVLGYENENGLGGRIRYWHYGHQTPLLGSGDGIRFQFDVYDVEATRHFIWPKTELVIAGGLRWADLEVLYNDRLNFNDLPGLTLAADLRSVMFGGCGREWATICGGRLSVLGGDWEGSSAGFIGQVRDDNMIVHELYGGLEYAYRSRRYDAFARLTIEVQNWHSDAAAQNTGADSFGFFGPGVHFGISR